MLIIIYIYIYMAAYLIEYAPHGRMGHNASQSRPREPAPTLPVDLEAFSARAAAATWP